MTTILTFLDFLWAVFLTLLGATLGLTIGSIIWGYIESNKKNKGDQ